ncbi:MAG: CBS domain-containing protein [Reyranella sp.]
MRAKDVMTEGVVCLHVGASIFDAAELLVGAGVSAVPVIDGKGRVVGIVSEADLMRRAEIGTAARKSWLSRVLASDATSAHQFVQSHSRRVAEVMTTEVVTAGEDTPLGKLAELMEAHGIKRIPIVRDGEVVGIVSRADLLRALLSQEPEDQADQPSDAELRRAVTAALSKHGWTSAWPTNVFVNAGVVHLWGFVPGESVQKAYRVAAENVEGVKRVKNHLRAVPASVGMGT